MDRRRSGQGYPPAVPPPSSAAPSPRLTHARTPLPPYAKAPPLPGSRHHAHARPLAPPRVHARAYIRAPTRTPTRPLARAMLTPTPPSYITLPFRGLVVYPVGFWVGFRGVGGVGVSCSGGLRGDIRMPSRMVWGWVGPYCGVLDETLIEMVGVHGRYTNGSTYCRGDFSLSSIVGGWLVVAGFVVGAGYDLGVGGVQGRPSFMFGPSAAVAGWGAELFCCGC